MVFYTNEKTGGLLRYLLVLVFVECLSGIMISTIVQKQQMGFPKSTSVCKYIIYKHKLSYVKLHIFLFMCYSPLQISTTIAPYFAIKDTLLISTISPKPVLRRIFFHK